MKAFAINLARSPERRVHIAAQLERAGVDYEIVAGTDGRSLTEAELQEAVDPALAQRAPRWLRPGSVGCGLSHLAVYRRIVEEGLEAALVLEDDAVLPPDCAYLLSALSSRLDRAEVALLYYTAKAPCRLSDQLAESLGRGFRLLYPIDLLPLNSALGYVVTRAACVKMIDGNMPLKSGADSWFNLYELGVLDRVRCVHPRAMGAKTDFKSTMDYSGGVRGGLQTTTAITRKRIFPFAQLLALRRALTVRKMSRFTVVPEASPFVGREARVSTEGP